MVKPVVKPLFSPPLDHDSLVFPPFFARLLAFLKTAAENHCMLPNVARYLLRHIPAQNIIPNLRGVVKVESFKRVRLFCEETSRCFGGEWMWNGIDEQRNASRARDELVCREALVLGIILQILSNLCWAEVQARSQIRRLRGGSHGCWSLPVRQGNTTLPDQDCRSR